MGARKCRKVAMIMSIHFLLYYEIVAKDKDKDKHKDKIKTVYCHVASTWNLDVVAYIIHTYIHT